MPLLISRNDITKIDAEAIVNAANTALQMGGGVCGAIFRAAGPAELQAACNKLGSIKTGEAVITDGFRSQAKYIIHTAGPIYQAGNTEQEKQLYDCYFNSLKLAAEKNLKSIAFPLISSGIYGYPPDKALSTALKSIHDFLGSFDGEITVYMIVYNEEAFAAAQKLYSGVENYIDEKLIVNDVDRRRGQLKFSRKSSDVECSESMVCESDIFANLEDGFNDILFNFIRQKQMTNADVYKNANLDRRLFSKIISNREYTPSKNTIFALAISLKLNLQETESLLKSAGYAISHSSKSDLIIEYYILHSQPKNYNIDDLNFLLFKHNQVQLGQV